MSLRFRLESLQEQIHVLDEQVEAHLARRREHHCRIYRERVAVLYQQTQAETDDHPEFGTAVVERLLAQKARVEADLQALRDEIEEARQTDRPTRRLANVYRWSDAWKGYAYHDGRLIATRRIILVAKRLGRKGLCHIAVTGPDPKAGDPAAVYAAWQTLKAGRYEPVEVLAVRYDRHDKVEEAVLVDADKRFVGLVDAKELKFAKMALDRSDVDLGYDPKRAVLRVRIRGARSFVVGAYVMGRRPREDVNVEAVAYRMRRTS